MTNIRQDGENCDNGSDQINVHNKGYWVLHGLGVIFYLILSVGVGQFKPGCLKLQFKS